MSQKKDNVWQTVFKKHVVNAAKKNNLYEPLITKIILIFKKSFKTISYYLFNEETREQFSDRCIAVALDLRPYSALSWRRPNHVQ